MKIERTSGKGPEQSFRVTVPAADMEKAVAVHLEDLSRDAKLPGFRPGKAPMAVLRQRFGKEAEGAAAGAAVESGIREALRQNKVAALEIRLAGKEPERAPDGALSFSFTVDTAPKVKLRPLERLQVEVPKSEPADADIDAEIASLRLLCGKTEAAGEGHAAREEDVLDLDLFDRTGPEERPVAMAASFDPPGFRRFWGKGAETAGLRKGDDRTLEVETPDLADLGPLAARKLKLGVRVREVHRRTPASMDEVAGRLGLKDEGEVRSALGSNLRQSLAEASVAVLCRRGLDALVEANPFEISEGYLARRTERALREAGRDPSGADAGALGEVRAAMERATRATILLDEVTADNGIEATSREVAEAVAATLPKDAKDPRAEFEKRINNYDLFVAVHRRILREKAFGLVLGRIRRTDVATGGQDLLRMAQEAGPPMVLPRRDADPGEGAGPGGGAKDGGADARSG